MKDELAKKWEVRRQKSGVFLLGWVSPSVTQHPRSFATHILRKSNFPRAPILYVHSFSDVSPETGERPVDRSCHMPMLDGIVVDVIHMIPEIHPPHHESHAPNTSAATRFAPPSLPSTNSSRNKRAPVFHWVSQWANFVGLRWNLTQPTFNSPRILFVGLRFANPTYVSTFLLPETFDTIIVEESIATKYDKILLQGLTNYHSIKWVAVMER